MLRRNPHYGPGRMDAAVGNSLVGDSVGGGGDFRLAPLMPQSRKPNGGFGMTMASYRRRVLGSVPQPAEAPGRDSWTFARSALFYRAKRPDAIQV